MYEPIRVELLDSMGSDLTVANVARVSMDKWHTEFKDPDDKKLINYLAKHDHWSPFGHCFLQFRITAPVFVARQLVKHQIGLCWNEVSRRYVDSDPTFYMPEFRARAENVKQGSKDEVVTAGGVFAMYDMAIFEANKCYKNLLEMGVAPEVAREVLPLSTMTSWIWSGSLAAFLRVCKLRLDPHAQKESRLVAEQIKEALLDKFPISYNAWMENK